MKINICHGISFITTILWILPQNRVYANSEWAKSRLKYRFENDHESSLPFFSTLELLDSPSRQRRYVPDSEPLDEYIHKDRLLFGPSGNSASIRQTKDIKNTGITEGKPPGPVQPGVSDNSASASRTVPSTSPPQSPPLPESVPSFSNKSVIISAELTSDNSPPSTSTTTKPADDSFLKDDLAISKFSDDMDKNTLKQNNISVKQEDSHVYYNSTFMVDSQIGQSYWVDMNKKDVTVNGMLSKAHRRAATVKLSFDFPFYGHLVRNVTIATGGFLYTGEYVHSWLAATQYIAPLMANFDTSISNDSYIKYVDNGTAFTVQWEKVVLQDKPTCGEFTFQATLHASGDIVFVYQNVPIVIENIQDDQHPVKVGLSDAYIIDRTIFFVRRKTIYEYHRVNFNKQDIKNWTVIYLNALPTCMEKKDCNSCVSANIGFECKWCPGVGRCSTGMDRKRQEWLHNECDRMELSTIQQCEELKAEMINHPSASAAASPEDRTAEGMRVSNSGYLGAAFIVVLIAGLAVWTLYAYSNPHSYSGQILIRYRPSQWSWRRGEARYTAATIHM